MNPLDFQSGKERKTAIGASQKTGLPKSPWSLLSAKRIHAAEAARLQLGV
jgi:hypothetical protein